MALFTASRALRVLSNSRVSNWTITKEKIIQSFQRKEVRRDGPDMSEYDAKFINKGHKGHDDHGYRPSDFFKKF